VGSKRVPTMGRCVCGGRIKWVDGEWHHVWWTKQPGCDKRVLTGTRYCAWVGEPWKQLRVATPRIGSAAALRPE